MLHNNHHGPRLNKYDPSVTTNRRLHGQIFTSLFWPFQVIYSYSPPEKARYMDLACRVYDELVKFKPSEVNSLFMQVKAFYLAYQKKQQKKKKLNNTVKLCGGQIHRGWFNLVMSLSSKN